MTCWLKFDSYNLGVDSSCVRHVKIYGTPKAVPENAGYYQPIEKNNTVVEIIKARAEKIHKGGASYDSMYNKDKEEEKKSKDVNSNVANFVDQYIQAGAIFGFGDLCEVIPPIKVAEIVYLDADKPIIPKSIWAGLTDQGNTPGQTLGGTTPGKVKLTINIGYMQDREIDEEKSQYLRWTVM